MKNTFSQNYAPRYSRMVEDRFSVPIPQDTSHINHSFCTSFYSERVCQGYSLKYVVSGRERYEVNGRMHTVTAGNFLVVSNGSMCKFQVEEKQTVEGLCLYLDSGLVNQVWQSLQQGGEHLLDRQEADSASVVPDFYENVFKAAHTPGLNSVLTAVQHTLQASDFSEAEVNEELFYGIAEELCQLQQESQAQLHRLPALKMATREELYRRLLLARDYLHDNLTEPVSLAVLADVASVSEYHFLRQFKLAFGQSPYQYLLQRRLHLAKQLLQAGGLTVGEAALACGFKEVQAFSKLFRKATGVAPTVFQRLQKI
ncbi:MAG: AraC family transcriptional regulator [Hymenobacteraceae bacterium]|nr:AraC family transcriptional regulator [Hymenobacteraceae bacterium]